jgi:hypothetical protein
MLLKARLDTAISQKVVDDDRMGDVLGGVMARMKPEAVYFGVDDGQRTMFAFFDLEDVSDMPLVGEPLFRELGAHITVSPMMTAEDLQQGLAKL